MWVPAIITSCMALGSLWLFGCWRVSFTLAMFVLIAAALVFGYHIHGALTNTQAMNYYHAGEANGYNRGYNQAILEHYGTANISLSDLKLW